jgi:[acyl-carrier-protein] S-malonyltransferase
MIDRGATHIVECGPGRVLAGLIRRIDKNIRVDMIENLASMDKALQP